MSEEAQPSAQPSVTEVVDRIMQGFAALQKPAKKRKPTKAQQQAAAYEGLIKSMPRHRLIACSIVNAIAGRERAAETFKTWGTPAEIAANIQKIKPAKLEKPKSLVKLSKLFPSPPTDRNQSSSDVL